MDIVNTEVKICILYNNKFIVIKIKGPSDQFYFMLSAGDLKNTKKAVNAHR